MSIELATGEGRLAIRLTGMDRVYALEGKVEVSLDTIADVRVVPRRAMEAERGVRAPGGAFPGKLAVGTWRGKGGKQFWCVHAAERVLVVDASSRRRSAALPAGTDDPPSGLVAILVGG